MPKPLADILSEGIALLDSPEMLTALAAHRAKSSPPAKARRSARSSLVVVSEALRGLRALAKRRGA